MRKFLTWIVILILVLFVVIVVVTTTASVTGEPGRVFSSDEKVGTKEIYLIACVGIRQVGIEMDEKLNKIIFPGQTLKLPEGTFKLLGVMMLWDKKYNIPSCNAVFLEK